MKNKKILIYANCQGKPIQFLLKDFFPEDTVIHISSHDYIQKKKELPKELFRNCDIFIYQPIDKKHRQYSTDFIKKEYLRKGTKLISFPYIYFLGYFPSHMKEVNDKKIGNLWPIYYVPCKKILEMRGESKDTEEIYDKLTGKDLFAKEEIENTLKYTIDILKTKEKETDVKISDFIENNFRNINLFYTPRHPTKHLMDYCASQILFKLGINNEADRKGVIDFFCDEVLPIYPCVKETLGLKFDHDIIFLKRAINLRQFIKINMDLYDIKMGKFTISAALGGSTIMALIAFDRLAGITGQLLNNISPGLYSAIKNYTSKVNKNENRYIS